MCQDFLDDAENYTLRKSSKINFHFGPTRCLDLDGRAIFCWVFVQQSYETRVQNLTTAFTTDSSKQSNILFRYRICTSL